MKRVETPLPGVAIIEPQVFGDQRGWFAETWSRRSLDVAFCQDNMSRSAEVGTVRGLHFQKPPHAQAKLVMVLKGRILDVAVESVTFAEVNERAPWTCGDTPIEEARLDVVVHTDHEPVLPPAAPLT